MNAITWPFKLPLRPVQAVIGLAETIGEQAQRELRDPARIRRELEDAQRRAAAGEISDEELAEIEDAAMRNLIPTANPGRPPAARRDEPADDDRS
jgi:Gas vesicle protein G